MNFEEADSVIRTSVTRIVKSNVQSETEINDTDTLKDLGMDSFKCMKIILDLEQEFNIEIDDEDLLIENYENIISIINLVNRLSNNSKP
jgi:acyl carrier protein